MWTPQYLDNSEAKFADFNGLIQGRIPAIVISRLYSENQCKEIVSRLQNYSESNFQETGLKHLGPFLMSYATRKKEYFENVNSSKEILKEIFTNNENPISKISFILKNSMSSSLSLANESENNYSSYVIRIHDKGHSIPLHKDNVQYEGREYSVSQIDHQLSCILHFQESEIGGDLVIYKKRWDREDEKFREINFGYSSEVISSSDFCQISNIHQGDLVIINPTLFHKVTTISGDTPRISLGMFLGFYENSNQVVAWA